MEKHGDKLFLIFCKSFQPWSFFATTSMCIIKPVIRAITLKLVSRCGLVYICTCRFHDIVLKPLKYLRETIPKL